VEGRIRYAALSSGGIFGFGSKLLAVPWEALTLLPDGKTFRLSIARETLENAVGFDKENWPQRPDPLLMATPRGSAEPSMPSSATSAAQGSSGVAGTRPGERLSATIQDLDAQSGTITLKRKDGKTVELQASAALLGGLQAGDAVEVAMSGKQATSIHKQERAQ